MTRFFKLLAATRDFDLASVLRAIAFIPVFCWVIYRYTIDALSAMATTIEWPVPPVPAISQLAVIADELQKSTVKDLRQLVTAPSKTTKTQLINLYVSI